jgi:hypothetical protein
MANATDIQAFLTAGLSFRDAWSNYDRNDANSRNALVAASVGLGAAANALIDGSPKLGYLGAASSLVSLSADLEAYNTAVSRNDFQGQTSLTFAIVSDAAGATAGLAAMLSAATAFESPRTAATLAVASAGLTTVGFAAQGAKGLYDLGNSYDAFLAHWGDDIIKNMMEEQQLFGGGPINQYANTLMNGVITAANAAEAGNTVKLSAGDSPEGATLALGFAPSPSGAARQIVFDPQAGTATILVGNGSGVTVAAGSQISVGSESVRASTFDGNGALEKQQDVFTNGTTAIKYLDTRNTHPYSELDISEDSTGKPTAAQMKLDGQPGNTADFSAVGQVFGSALGRALAPNNQFAQIAVGTVAGAIGQQLAQTFAASPLTDASKIDLSNAFTDFRINIAGAGAGAVASFLTAFDRVN